LATKIKIRGELLPTQRLAFDDDTTDTLLQCGGLGSGKTHSLVIKMLKLSYLNAPYSGGVMSPSYADFKRDVLPEFQQVLENNKIRYLYHQQDKYFRFPWSAGKLYVFTAEKPIAGPNLAYCGINEFSLIQYERITEMLRRVRIKTAKRKQKFLTGTPEDLHGWLEQFIEMQMSRGPNEFKLLTAATKENTHIDEKYSDDLAYLLDERALAVFRDGKIGRVSGDYFYYSYDEARHVSDSAVYDPNLTIHVGLDFNVGKMAVSFSHKINDRQIFFDEMLLTGDSNTYTVAAALRNKYPVDKMLITCDSAGKNRQSAARQGLMSDVSVLRSEGYNVRFFPANPRLRYRQILVNGMLAHDRIVVNARCKNLRRDLKAVRQAQDMTKIEGSDHSLSHMSDGMDYVLCFEHKIDVLTRKSTQVAW
jgi:hypothetical protein